MSIEFKERKKNRGWKLVEILSNFVVRLSATATATHHDTGSMIRKASHGLKRREKEEKHRKTLINFITVGWRNCWCFYIYQFEREKKASMSINVHATYIAFSCLAEIYLQELRWKIDLQ
jgi:hypothetical protein